MRGVRVLVLSVVVLCGVGACSDDEPTVERSEPPATDEAGAPSPTSEGGAAASTGECAGDLVLVASTNGEDEETGDVVGLTADGQVRRLTTDGAGFGPAVSPDGSLVAFTGIGDDGEVSDSFGPYNTDIYVVGADGTGRRRVVDGDDDREPAWSPDGGLIAFVRGGDPDTGEPADRIHVVAPDGRGDRELVSHDGPEDDTYPVWSPDGSRLVFVRRAADRSRLALVVVAADGTGEQELFTSTDLVGRPAWSPDGERVAVPVGSGELARLTVLDASSGEVVATSSSGVAGVAWAPSGRLYAFARPPAVRDVSGQWRLTELEPDGDGFAEGRVVSAVEPVWFLYTDYRVDVPACLDPGSAALTGEADVPEGLTVVDPATGEEAVVLTREQVVERLLDSVTDEPEGWADEAEMLLVFGDEATNAALCADEPAPASAVGEPDPAAPPPCLYEVPDTLVWLVANDGSLHAFDARSGDFLFGGGGPGATLPDVPDLAPA